MKKLLANCLILLASLGIAFALAEAGARLFLSPPQKIITNVKASTDVSAQTQEKLNQSLLKHPDEGGLYRGTPTGRRLHPNRIVTIQNHRLSYQKVVIETNELGYRNPEIGPKDGTRILFLGDSITFADYLNEEDTFVRLVEHKARQNGKDWETINAGVGAISLKNELAILMESGLDLEPDVVVLNFYLNDFQKSRGVKIIRLPKILETSWFLYHLTDYINQMRGITQAKQEEIKLDLPTWKQEFVDRSELTDGRFNESPAAFNTMVKNSFRDYGGAWSYGAWEYMRPLFEEFAQLAKQHDFKLVIVIHPVYQQVYTEFVMDFPQQQMLAIADDLDVATLDLLPGLREEALRNRDPSIYHGEEIFNDLFYDQCHHTPAGSHYVAEAIYQFLSSEMQ